MGLKTNVMKRGEGNLVISLNGSLDTKTYEDFDKLVGSVLRTPMALLVIDLAGLEHISTLGVSALLKAKQLAEAGNGRFSVINVQPQVQKVFNIIKAIPDISIFTSLEEADEYFEAIQEQEKAKQKEEKKGKGGSLF